VYSKHHVFGYTLLRQDPLQCWLRHNFDGLSTGTADAPCFAGHATGDDHKENADGVVDGRAAKGFPLPSGRGEGGWLGTWLGNLQTPPPQQLYGARRRANAVADAPPAGEDRRVVANKGFPLSGDALLPASTYHDRGAQGFALKAQAEQAPSLQGGFPTDAYNDPATWLQRRPSRYGGDVGGGGGDDAGGSDATSTQSKGRGEPRVSAGSSARFPLGVAPAASDGVQHAAADTPLVFERCCAQFLVSRSVVRRQPKAFYEVQSAESALALTFRLLTRPKFGPLRRTVMSRFSIINHVFRLFLLPLEHAICSRGTIVPQAVLAQIHTNVDDDDSAKGARLR